MSESPSTQESAVPTPTSTREKMTEKFDSVQEQFGRAKKAAGSLGSAQAILADFLSPIGPITIIGSLLFMGLAGFSGYKWFGKERKDLNDDLASGKIDVDTFNDEVSSNKWVSIFSYSSIAAIILLFFAVSGALGKNPKRGAIAGNVTAIQKIQNDILGLKKDVAALKRAGGLILSPSSASDHCHNARLYQQRGKRSEAKDSYKKAIASNPQQVDVHMGYQSLLKDMEGISGARKAYKVLKAKYPTSPTVRFAYSLLLEDKPRIAALEKLAKDSPDFLPALAQLSKEFSNASGGQQTITDKQKESLYLKQFAAKNQGGAYQKYFFNSDLAKRDTNDMQRRQRLYGKAGVYGHMIKNPVQITIAGAGPGNHTVTFVIVGTVAKEIYYKLSEDDEFKATGFMATKNPMTGQPYPNMYVMTSKIKPGENQVWVKYKNAKDEMVGPFKKTVMVKSASADASDKFVRYIWRLPQMRRVGTMYMRGRTMITFVYANDPKNFKYLKYSIDNPSLRKTAIRNGRGKKMIRTRMRPGAHTLYVQFQLVTGWKSPKLRYNLNITRKRGLKWVSPAE